jgi:signal peptidase II
LKRAAIIIFLVLLVDQVSKVWIKTHMAIGDEFSVMGDWFMIHFLENNGMAWGMSFGGEYGKLFLSLFRLVAITGIGYYLYTLVKSKKDSLLITSISLIFAGAVGNIIDSLFYGIIFEKSTSFHVAQAFPADGGYATLFHGKVVDMLHFPLFNGIFPDWFPFVGGNYFEFFEPVFNIADSSITIGVLFLFYFRNGFLLKPKRRTKSKKKQLTSP